jgi:HEAT repeat protein
MSEEPNKWMQSRPLRWGLLVVVFILVGAALVVYRPWVLRVKGKTIDEWIDALDHKESKREAQRALETAGPKAVPRLLNRLENAQGESRDNILSVISNISMYHKLPEEAVGPLLGAMADLKDDNQLAAAIAIAKVDPPPIDTLTKNLSQHANARVQEGCARALNRLGSQAEKATDTLIDRVEKGEPRVKLQAALALAYVAPEKAFVGVGVLLDNLAGANEPKPQKEILSALKTMKTNPSSEIIQRFLKTDDKDVKLRFALALQKMGPRAKETVGQLRPCLGDPELEFGVSKALGAIDPDNERLAVDKLLEYFIKAPAKRMDISEAIEKPHLVKWETHDWRPFGEMMKSDQTERRVKLFCAALVIGNRIHGQREEPQELFDAVLLIRHLVEENIKLGDAHFAALRFVQDLGPAGRVFAPVVFYSLSDGSKVPDDLRLEVKVLGSLFPENADLVKEAKSLWESYPPRIMGRRDLLWGQTLESSAFAAAKKKALSGTNSALCRASYWITSMTNPEKSNPDLSKDFLIKGATTDKDVFVRLYAVHGISRFRTDTDWVMETLTMALGGSRHFSGKASD